MARKRNFRLLLEYDGTDFFGWQIQKDRRTVQGELRAAVMKITGKASTIIGAGRTDAGVHAFGQVANFHTTSAIPTRKWPRTLNAKLPGDIAVREVAQVDLDFHAQFNATSKIYTYTILNQSEKSALMRNRAHLVRPDLDADAMAAASRVLVGEHDFRSFGSDMAKKEKTVRTILSFDVVRRDALITFTVHGTGFLYNQVRSMVGTLIEVGLGKQAPEWVKGVLDAKDRRRAGANVPARGLVLHKVLYDEK